MSLHGICEVANWRLLWCLIAGGGELESVRVHASEFSRVVQNCARTGWGNEGELEEPLVKRVCVDCEATCGRKLAEVVGLSSPVAHHVDRGCERVRI